MWQHNSFISKCLKLLKGLCICVCLLSMRLWNINIGRNCFTFRAADSKQMNHGIAYGMERKKPIVSKLIMNMPAKPKDNYDFKQNRGLPYLPKHHVPARGWFCDKTYCDMCERWAASGTRLIKKKTITPLRSNRFQAHESEKKLKGPTWLNELPISC